MFVIEQLDGRAQVIRPREIISEVHVSEFRSLGICASGCCTGRSGLIAQCVQANYTAEITSSLRIRQPLQSALVVGDFRPFARTCFLIVNVEPC